ncbi:MAG: response regulator [Myxococcales bacterium]
MASKKTILVLDDDPSVRHMVRVLLEQQGHAVVTVGDARSALAQCAVQLPDLMIVDLMLPIEDGEMFLREFHRRWRQVTIPVIVLSASTARNDIARRLGAEATLAKPFFAEDLRELVALHVQAGEELVAG